MTFYECDQHGADQTVQMHSLISALAVRYIICMTHMLDTCSF